MNGRGPRIEAPVFMRILNNNLTIEENNNIVNQHLLGEPVNEPKKK